MEHLLFPEHSDSFHGPSNLIMKAARAEVVVLFTAAREGTEQGPSHRCPRASKSACAGT